MATSVVLVETKDGKRGRVYPRQGKVKGKTRVYLFEKDGGNNILCEPKSLTVVGYEN